MFLFLMAKISPSRSVSSLTDEVGSLVFKISSTSSMSLTRTAARNVSPSKWLIRLQKEQHKCK